jgi:hypothetical protein
LTVKIGPGALHWTAADLAKLEPNSNEEDAVSDYARSLAVDLLTKSAKLTAYSIAPESVEQFEHDLLLRWNFDNRGMILTCPAAEGAGPSLYRETIKGNKSETVELKQNINAEQLAEAMEWLFDR